MRNKYILNEKLITLFFLFSSLFFLGINKYFIPSLYSLCIFLFLFLFMCFYCSLKNIALKSKYFFICMFYILSLFLILLIQNYLFDLKYGFLNEFARHIPPILTFFICRDLIKNYNLQKTVCLCKKFLFFNVFLYCIECIFRISISIIKNGFFNNFYNYKMDSIFFVDSNFVGLNLVVLLIWIDQIKFLQSDFLCARSVKKIKFLIIILLFLTFSRTAYIIYVLYLIFSLFLAYRKKRFLLFSLSLLLIFSLPFVIDAVFYIIHDGSFKTKIDILFGFINFMSIESFFVGVGSGNAIDYLQRESHNIFGLIFEMGFIWFLLIVSLFVYIIKQGKKYAFLVSFPIIISGIVSLFPIAYLSFYFICIVLLNHLSNLKRNLS